MTIIVCSVIGHLLYTLFLPQISKPYARTFTKLGLGIVALATCYALFYTKGQSVLILFIVLTILLALEKIVRFNTFSFKTLLQNINVKPYILNVMIPSIFFFVWEGFFMFKTGNFNFTLPPSDYHHYSEISSALSITGQENIFGIKNTLLDTFYGTTPYHYFELWFNNITANSFNIPNIISLMLICFPVFFTLSYIGFCAIFEKYNTVGVKEKLLSILLFGIGGVFLQFYSLIPYLGSGQLLCVIPIDTYYRKYIFYYPFVIGFWLLFENKKIVPAFIILLSLIVISAGALPGIISGILLFVITCLFSKRYDKKSLVKLTLYSLLISIAWVGFYYITSNKEVSVNNLDELVAIETWKNGSTYKTIANIYVLTILQYSLYFLPFMIIFLFMKKQHLWDALKQKKLPSHIVWVSVLFFTSLSCWAFMHLTGNARQFFSNGFAVVLCVWIILQLSKKNSSSNFIWGIVILLTSINYYYAFNNNLKSSSKINNDDYLIEVNTSLEKIEKNVVVGGILFSKEETNDITQRRDKAFHIYPLAHYTNLSSKIVDVQNLSVFDAPELADKTKEKRFKHLINVTPFYQFVTQQKQRNTFKNIEASQKRFIDEFDLDFIVLRKNAVIPSYLKPIIKEIKTDGLSGDKFILLAKR